jgi:hypothetical protein
MMDLGIKEGFLNEVPSALVSRHWQACLRAEKEDAQHRAQGRQHMEVGL